MYFGVFIISVFYYMTYEGAVDLDKYVSVSESGRALSDVWQ